MTPESMVAESRSAVAYFSMEMALDAGMPTYSGGLGVLAGDTLRAAADLGVPMVGVTLLHRKGYFRQHLDAGGNQTESPATWSPEHWVELVPGVVSVVIEGRQVRVRAWRYVITGVSGHTVPVYLLDTALPDNSPWDHALTDSLYGGDEWYRLCQEIVLGLGGIAVLRELGGANVQTYHMNEGHAALLALALLVERAGSRGLGSVTEADLEAVRRRCVFTTHTPVPAGHDQFPLDLVRRALGPELVDAVHMLECHLAGRLNMTYLALFFSRYTNGVSLRHEEISRSMFPRYPINSITNGVHAATWAAPPLADLFDQHIPEWRRDNLYLRYAHSIPLADIQAAHTHAKQELLAEVQRRTGRRLDPAVFTLGFARRAAAYKQADLLFADLERLRRIVREAGPLQVIFGGKAHPRDEVGKGEIRRVFEAARALGDAAPVVYLEEYDTALARQLVAGVDAWLNTPRKPLEASGTSGMKAALNGVPSLSVLDGWWIEGCLPGVTGWAIGDDAPESDPVRERAELYDRLEREIVPLFYQQPEAFARVMRSAIAINGSFYNTQRMVRQYQQNAYHVPHTSE